MSNSFSIVDEVVKFSVEQPRQALNFTVATQGPPGPPGDAPRILASITLGGNRVIATTTGGEGVYADCTNTTAQRVVGFSTGASDAGTFCDLKRTGTISWPAGGLTPEAVLFLRENGLVSHTPPATGWLRQVGVAADAGTIHIDIGPAYWLGE